MSATKYFVTRDVRAGDDQSFLVLDNTVHDATTRSRVLGCTLYVTEMQPGIPPVYVVRGKAVRGRWEWEKKS